MSQEISILLSLKTAEAAQKFDEFLGHATHGLRELAGELIGAYVGIEGIKKLFEVTSEVIQLEEAIGKLAEKTGLSIPMLAALHDQANILKVPFEELSTSLGKFSQLIFDAATQGGKPGEAFERMGISLLDVDGALKKTDAILAEVAQKFREMPAGPEKSATAVALFGRAGRDIIPILNEGAEGIERMKAAGSPITEEGVANATEYEHALREVHQRVEEIFITVANKLLPQLIKLADSLKEFASDADNSSLAATTLVDVFKGLITVGIVLVSALRDIGLYIGGGLGIAMMNINDQINIVIRTFNSLVEAIKKVLQAFVALAGDALAAQQVISDAATGHLVDAVGKMKFLAADSAEQMKTIFTAIPNALADSAQNAYTVMKTAFERTKNFALDTLLEVGLRWMGVKQTVDDLWNPAKSTAAGTTKSGAAGDGKFFPGPTSDDLRRAADLAKMAQEIFKQNEKMIQNNPFASQVEKARELLPLIREQKQIVMDEIAKASARVDAANGDDAKIAAKKELIKLQGELNDLTEKETKAESLTSFKDQFKLAQVDLENSWGSWASQTANVFKTTFMNAVSTISTGITGLIMGTKTWGQAIRDIGTGIMTQVVQSIIQMGVQWVMTHVIMRGAMALTHALGVALGWTQVAETNAQEAAKAPALAANAGSAAVGSFGASAVIGMALAIAAIGAIIAFASARESGGPVTAGMPYIVGERRPELFIPSQSGTILPSVPSVAGFGQLGAGAPYPVDGGEPAPVHLHIVDSVEAAHKRAESDPDHENWVVDVVNRNLYRIRKR